MDLEDILEMLLADDADFTLEEYEDFYIIEVTN